MNFLFNEGNKLWVLHLVGDQLNITLNNVTWDVGVALGVPYHNYSGTYSV